MSSVLAICIGASLGTLARWGLGLVTGFLGALTTFSTFSAEVGRHAGQQRYALAFGTAALHLLGSLLLTILGIRSALFFLTTRA